MDANIPFGERLKRLREAAGLTQAELAERSGLTPDAIGVLERGQRQHPYPATVRALASALGLSERERQILLLSVPKRGAAGPPAPDPRPSPAALPVPPTPLVGRERELREIGDLLNAGMRLLTLTGASGVGKTRLAIHIAGDVRHRFPDGIAFVPLAPVNDPALVVPTIARFLGLAEGGGQTFLETLRSYLRDARMLLVLDNFEHVLDAAPEVADLLATCPGLVVLATSRSPLRTRGEGEYPVTPLGLPDLSRVPAPEDASRSDAVRLFVQRARAVDPRFELTRSNAAAVAVICRRLDGLPLAIELAAVRLRSLSPTELLARLDRTLPLLTGGARDLPERQRTMRAAIEWSYRLLEESQSRLLNRLSVFRGGWDLKATEAVGTGGVIAAAEVLDLLSSLVEQSLVLTEPQMDGSSRYRMLMPVREYAEERLVESGEAEETRLRHAKYFLALAEQVELPLSGPDAGIWLSRLAGEHDNLRIALAWLLDETVGSLWERAERAEIALRLATALRRFWEGHGHVSEGHGWVVAALAADAGVPTGIRARALGTAGWRRCDRASTSGRGRCSRRAWTSAGG